MNFCVIYRLIGDDYFIMYLKRYSRRELSLLKELSTIVSRALDVLDIISRRSLAVRPRALLELQEYREGMMIPPAHVEEVQAMFSWGLDRGYTRGTQCVGVLPVVVPVAPFCLLTFPSYHGDTSIRTWRSTTSRAILNNAKTGMCSTKVSWFESDRSS